MSKPYKSTEYLIDLDYRAKTDPDGRDIIGICYNKDDTEKTDPIYIIWDEREKAEINYLAFNGERVILINERAYWKLKDKDNDVEALFWHELGHWFYRDEQTNPADYERLRGEAYDNGSVIIDEIRADDYSVSHFGKNKVKNALAHAKKEFGKAYPEQKGMLKEFQRRIDRLL